MVLKDYNMGSGYGSLSRTVEEIILAFDAVYKTMLLFTQLSQNLQESRLTDKQKLEAFALLLTMVVSVGNAVSRLQLPTQQPQV